MAMRLIRSIYNLPILVHLLLVAGSFAYFQMIKGILDRSYLASKHPVDFATGQTRFSAEAVRGYYAKMTNEGTLEIYWETQFIDFGFILAVILLGLFLASLPGRLATEGSWARRVSMGASITVICGGLCDLIENLISFVMLSDPAGFADWIAILYSSFAVAKFALIATGLSLFAISWLLLILGRLTRHPKIG